MPPATVSRLQFQDYQFSVVLPAGTWKWTTRVDVSQALPQYQVRDVLSPFGTLRDMIPIPGDVITAMAASITQLQSNFAPSILLSPTSLVFTLTEGEGVSAPQAIQLTNSGVFGSLLGVAITTSAPWLKVIPANVDGLASNEVGIFQVTADSLTLLNSNTPYAATVTVTDADATNSPQTIPVTVNVLPKPTISVSPLSLSFVVEAPLSGNPFPAIPSQQFNLTNSGPAGSQLTYLIRKLIGNSPWLTSFTPFMGQLASTQTQPITVAVVPPASMIPGSYTETLRISGFSTNMVQDVTITLLIE